MPLLLVAPSNLLPARRSARFGAAAKTAVASEALTSVGVRGTRLRTSTAHDLAQSVVTAPHVAVASGRLIVVLFGSRAVRNPRPRRCALEALAAIEGEAQGATPSRRSGAAAAGYGYRYGLFLASAASTAGPLCSPCRERAAGHFQAGAGRLSGIRAAIPQRGLTTSLKWTRNGRPPWPRLRYAVHFLSPGQGVLPPRAP